MLNKYETEPVSKPEFKKPIFSWGRIHCFPELSKHLDSLGLDLLDVLFEHLDRHTSSDYGDLIDSDIEQNERGLEEGGQVLSSYRLPDNQTFYVITNFHKNTTTFLLPEEYPAFIKSS